MELLIEKDLRNCETPLTDQCELMQRAKDGDRDAREAIILANVGLVFAVVRRCRQPGIDDNDLVGEGIVGLVLAVDRFEVRDVAFGAYAFAYVYGYVRMAINKYRQRIRVAQSALKLSNAVRRKQRQVANEQGTPLTLDEAAETLELSDAQKRRVADVQRAYNFTSDHMGDGRETSRIDQHVVDPRSDTDDPELTRWELADRLKRLNKRQRSALELRHGLSGQPELSFNEISLQWGVSHQYVRKTEQRAQEKLRAMV
jgi:RNA polymerase sigma factor (sigma-70 family)